MHTIDEFLGLLKAYNSKAIPLYDIVPIFLQVDDFHNFMHYISDEDIRLKDESYASMQDAEVAKFSPQLKPEFMNKQIKLHFLVVSHNNTRHFAACGRSDSQQVSRVCGGRYEGVSEAL